MFALNLDKNNRILSATLEEFADAKNILVETLPDGDIANYKYIRKKYVYDPLPQPEPPAPTAENDLTAMTVDHEYRLTLLELGL